MPERIFIDKEDRSFYERVKKENTLNFQNKNQKDQFLLAVAIGFDNKQKRGIKIKDEFFYDFDLRPEDTALLNAVALYEGSTVDIIDDDKKVFNIAQQYASAGIRILCDTIDNVQFGEFDKHFEKDLANSYRKLFEGSGTK